MKEYLLVYSETAAKRYGFNKVTLTSGEVFKVTLLSDIKSDLKDLYHYKDRKIIARVFESEIISNVSSKEIQKNQENEILKRMQFPAIKEIITTLSQNDLYNQKKDKAKRISDKIKAML